MGETGSMSLSSSAAGDGLYLCWYTASCAKKACLLMIWRSCYILYCDEGSDKKKVLVHAYYIQNIHEYDELNLVCPKSSQRKCTCIIYTLFYKRFSEEWLGIST